MSVRLVREESGPAVLTIALPLLVREIGPARTIELVTTCQRIHATEAQS